MFIRKSTPDTSVLLHRETMQKHGSHDQKTHGKGGKGSGGEPRRRGKDIIDLSVSDRKKFTSRMASAKTMEEARAIIEEFKPKLKAVVKHSSHDQKTHGRKGGGGGGGGGGTSSNPKATTFSAQTERIEDITADAEETYDVMDDELEDEFGEGEISQESYDRGLRAKEELSEAIDHLGQASNAKNSASRISSLDSAADRLDNASRAVRNTSGITGYSSTFERYADKVDDEIEQLRANL
jgi:hypothetical protein